MRPFAFSLFMTLSFLGASGISAAETKTVSPVCNWDVSRAPAIYGFKLGMKLDDAVRRFPDLPELGAAVSKPSTSINRDYEDLITVATANDGTKIVSVIGPYLVRRFDPAGAQGTVSKIDLYFSRGLLSGLRVVDWETGAKSREEFLSATSKKFGFSRGWWKHQSRAVAADYASLIDSFECTGFSVSSDCIGPPGPPGMCTLSISRSSR
jgi:hypothetical protein